MKTLFQEKSKYNLLDFHISHNELLLRGSPVGDRKFNIDILFKGVFSMNIVTRYKGLTISVVTKQEGQTTHLGLPDKFIFQLSGDDMVKTYIEAAAFGIFHNYLEFGESSIGEFLWSNSNKCIYWSNDDEELKRVFK